MSRVGLAAFAAVALAAVAALAQAPPSPGSPPAAPQGQPPAAGNSLLRAMPAGPGDPVAELQGLDKVTARTQRFLAPVGKTTAFGTLEITVGDCLVNTPDAPADAVAYLTIVDRKPGQAQQKLFTGWMFASTPSISALDDGVYDVRVVACTRTQGSAAPSSR